MSSTSAWVLSRGDSVGTLLLVPLTHHQIEFQSERPQTKHLQSVWVITPSQATRPGVISAEGVGVTASIPLEGDDTTISLPYHRLARHAL